MIGFRPAVSVAISFVDCINRRDLTGLASLMSDDHRLEVFDEPPLAGKQANVEAWGGYFASFPRYVIYPSRVAERNNSVAILGHTTGSHLGLPDDEERRLTLIWIVETADSSVTCWKLIEDNPANRKVWGLDAV